MGMFDFISFEQPVFDIPSGTKFQTKSFGCLMEDYIVTTKGEIYREIYEYEYIKDNEHFLGGYINKVKDSYRREYLTDYHGDIIFYDKDPVDYIARFTHGKLEKIIFKSREWMNESVLHQHTAVRKSNSSSRSEERKTTIE